MTYSDEFLSKHYRIQHKTACAEPIYEDGQPTGEFRLWRRPRGWDDFRWTWAKDHPWETTVSSREEALTWLRSAANMAQAKG